MQYKKPQQSRAALTEQRFLIALEDCLRQQSLSQTTVDEIAQKAGLHRGAFLKRFGSKKGALIVLYHHYCQSALAEVSRILSDTRLWTSALYVCIEASESLERIQTQHFGSNRAMHEHYLEVLETDEQTKQIFLATVNLFLRVQEHFLEPKTYSKSGAYAATQLLVTINYNFVLKAMPGLPSTPTLRHLLIAECMLAALKH
jgi:AcrR family transcriptional regulator